MAQQPSTIRLLSDFLQILIPLPTLCEANPYTERVPPIYNVYKTVQGRLSTSQLLET